MLARTAPTLRLLALSVLSLLGACASTGTYVAPAPDAPAALVVGEDPTFLEGLDPLATTASTWFEQVDDDTLSRSAWSGYPDQVRVPPGKHALSVGGAVRQRGRVIAAGDAVFHVDFEAGQTYHVSTSLVPGQPGEVEILMETSDSSTNDG